jgi:hypothetical protein
MIWTLDQVKEILLGIFKEQHGAAAGGGSDFLGEGNAA